MQKLWYNFRLIFQFGLILFVTFFVADVTALNAYFMLKSLNSTNNYQYNIAFAVCFIFKFLGLPIMYYLLGFSHITEIKNFVSDLRNSKRTKIAILILVTFLPFFILAKSLILLLSIVGLGEACIVFILATMGFYCLATWSYLLLYLIWYIIDKIKGKRENIPETISASPVISAEVDIDSYKRVSTFRFVLFSIITNYIYEIFKMFQMQKFLNNLDVENKKIPKYIIVGYIILSLILALFGYITELFNEWITLYPAIIGLLLYLTGYVYTLYGLRRLESMSLTRHNRLIKYNRIYAFLLGPIYMNYAINNYDDRVNNRSLTKKDLLIRMKILK